MDEISSFTNEYAFLSNSYNHPITYDGLTYLNAEACFWAQRVKDVKARKKYTGLNAQKARAKAQQVIPIDDWEDKKDDIMMSILQVKFSDEKFKQLLLQTKPKRLINATTFRDPYWGTTIDGKGRNMLGHLLEKIRDQM